MPRTILCPVDFSETSTRALDYAADLATKIGARVHVLHVFELPPYTLPDEIGPDFLGRFTNELRAQLEEHAKRGGPGATSQLVVQGIAYREIVRVARELPAHLIVMGTHGRTGVVRLLLGSVAERVLRTASVPVLSVPERA